MSVRCDGKSNSHDRLNLIGKLPLVKSSSGSLDSRYCVQPCYRVLYVFFFRSFSSLISSSLLSRASSRSSSSVASAKEKQVARKSISLSALNPEDCRNNCGLQSEKVGLHCLSSLGRVTPTLTAYSSVARRIRSISIERVHMNLPNTSRYSFWAIR